MILINKYLDQLVEQSTGMKSPSYAADDSNFCFLRDFDYFARHIGLLFKHMKNASANHHQSVDPLAELDAKELQTSGPKHSTHSMETKRLLLQIESHVSDLEKGIVTTLEAPVKKLRYFLVDENERVVFKKLSPAELETLDALISHTRSLIPFALRLDATEGTPTLLGNLRLFAHDLNTYTTLRRAPPKRQSAGSNSSAQIHRLSSVLA